ncbi:MAG: ISL3 family transposase [Nitrospira sp.]|nr:ISL3 family transposase [Nitrospira sp.]
MLIQTLLNQCQKFKSFVYDKAQWEKVGGVQALVVRIIPRRNSRGQCGKCGEKAGTYDHQEERRFRFVPLWGIPVYFRYQMRRVNCSRHGVRVESVPWAQGKSQRTQALELFLARWARRLSWKEVGLCFEVSWESVYRSVKAVVDYGLKMRQLRGIEAIGVDEMQYAKGSKYMTLVYQIDEGFKRLLSVTEGRRVRSLLEFFRALGREQTQKLKYICSDMWKPYLKVIAKKAPQALHVLDRFHIVVNLNKALDQIRASEARRMTREGYEEVLKHTKYCFLKRRENLKPDQKTKLKEVLSYDLKTVRAYLLKESFQLLWTYSSPHWARWYLTKWCGRANRSRLVPIKRFVRSMRKHQEKIFNWFKAKKQISAGSVEGMNRKINLTTRKAYGFRSFEVLKIALFHTMGQLPEPESTHRFC